MKCDDFTYWCKQQHWNNGYCSGLLLAYLWLKEVARSEGQKIKSLMFWITYYVHRYFRFGFLNLAFETNVCGVFSMVTAL